MARLSEEAAKRVLIVIGSVLVVLGCWFGYSWYRQNQSLKAEQAMLTSLQNQSAVLTKQIAKPTYVVDPRGKLSASDQAMLSRIQKTFTLTVQWRSASEYTHNRKLAQTFIKDPSFFNTFMTADDDGTGHSKISALNLKSQSSQVTAYRVDGNQYYVEVEYYMYHHAQDLHQLDKLTPSLSSFYVSGDENGLTKVSQVSGLALTNS